MAGTFPLPEAQLDRFLLKLSVGYPDREAEGELLDANSATEAITRLGPGVDTAEIIAMQQFCHGVDAARAGEDVHRRRLPGDPHRPVAADGRQLARVDQPGQGLAASAPRRRAATSCCPTTCGPCSAAVIEHRLILTPDAQLRDETVGAVLERILARIPVPLGVGAARRCGRR